MEASNQSISTLALIQSLYEDIQGNTSETQEGHRVKYNKASMALYDLPSDLTEEEQELRQEVFDFIAEIKPQMAALNKAHNDKGITQVNEELPERFQAGLKKAWNYLNKMDGNKIKQKMTKEAILDVGCGMRRNSRTNKLERGSMEIAIRHPEKEKLWKVYNEKMLELTQAELEQKSLIENPVEEVVKRLELLPEIISKYQDQVNSRAE